MSGNLRSFVDERDGVVAGRHAKTLVRRHAEQPAIDVDLDLDVGVDDEPADHRVWRGTLRGRVGGHRDTGVDAPASSTDVTQRDVGEIGGAAGTDPAA